MTFSTIFSRPGALCILLTLLGNVGSSFAASPALVARGSGKDDMMPDAPDDGGQSPSTDGKAGIGMEFETAYIQFESKKAKADDVDISKTYQSKRKVINGIKGDHYSFTADLLLRKGAVDLEIILDGKSIVPGTDVLWKTLEKAMAELKRWNPSVESSDRKVTIEGSPFDDWQIMDPPKKDGYKKVQWTPQLTAPMPLEAIQWLIENVRDGDKEYQMFRPGQNTVKVFPEFFKTKPGGVEKDDVEDRPDVLGFFSLILTYAKIAQKTGRDGSPKGFSTIMPRTDWTTMYKTQGISDVIPAKNLYDIVKALACFKNTGKDDYDIDNKFCTGSKNDPKPNDQMDKQAFQLGDDGKPLTIEEWIKSISDGKVPDALTTFDQQLSSSIGGFGTALENVIGTTRAVPIFEFRKIDLQNSPEEAIALAKTCEKNVVKLHDKFKKRPSD